MRYVLELPARDRLDWARRADAAGLSGVVVRAVPGAESALAAAVAGATRDAHVVMALALGHEHPLTLVEEVNVVDNISEGRVVVLLTAEGVDQDRAREEVELVRLAGSQRAFSYDGAHWSVPARLPEHDVPATIMVTPPPAQLVVPLWAEHSVPHVPGLVRLDDQDPDPAAQVQPVTLALTGDRDADLAAGAALREVGATHCLARLPETDTDRAFDQLVRWLVPDSAMVDFPRVVADVDLPAPWPGATALPATSSRSAATDDQRG